MITKSRQKVTLIPRCLGHWIQCLHIDLLHHFDVVSGIDNLSSRRLQMRVQIPRTVNAGAYNSAKAILTDAGSKTAEKSHNKHGEKSSPIGHAQDLLAEARDEFRKQDVGETKVKSGMSEDHHKAILSAAEKMGLYTEGQNGVKCW